MTDMNTPQLIIVQDREAALRAQLGQALGRIVELEAEVATLRQPCAHQPPGSEPGCGYCRLRHTFMHHLMNWLKTTDRAEMRVIDALHVYDAACQAVREGA